MHCEVPLYVKLTCILTVSENEIIQGTQKAFIGVKNARDCHDEMNGEHFEEYVRFVVNHNSNLYQFYITAMGHQ